jgi:hypothetical protein
LSSKIAYSLADITDSGVQRIEIAVETLRQLAYLTTIAFQRIHDGVCVLVVLHLRSEGVELVLDFCVLQISLTISIAPHTLCKHHPHKIDEGGCSTGHRGRHSSLQPLS